MIKTDAQIEAEMQEHINATWPPAMREKALRLGGDLLAQLNAFFVDCGVVKQAKIAERDLAQEVADYDAAATRLQRPALVVSDDVMQEAVDADIAERASAQAVIDGASSEVVAIVAARGA